MVVGDFNEIVYSHEKEGGAPRPVRMMQNFRDALVDCELDDMGFSGEQFTWRRRRIRERLDSAVYNAGFHGLFPHATVTNAPHLKSDHRPVVLDTEGDEADHIHQGQRQHQFEARWLQENEVMERVSEAWARTPGSASLSEQTAAVHG